MAGKLAETANITGGKITGCALIDGATFLVDETTARAPSYYRAEAVAQDRTFNRTDRVSRTLISAPGASVAGDLRTRAPVVTSQPVVQHFFAADGEWRRISTSESAWGAWRATDRPVAPTGWSTPANGFGDKGGFDAAEMSGEEAGNQLALLIADLIANGTLAE